jgi:hypothetical protein
MDQEAASVLLVAHVDLSCSKDWSDEKRDGKTLFDS